MWPRLRLSIGSTLVGTLTVDSSTWKPYALSLVAPAGTQEIRVAFDNDAVLGTEDRNLYLDQLVVGCPSP